MKVRIAKYLAACGLLSRRKNEELILSGKIKVNGKVVKNLSCKVSNDDNVEYNGNFLKPQENIVIALNKPPGYLSTVKDDFKRKTVLSLVKDLKLRLFPVGRLDNNSRGLIFLTNDGDFAYKVTHPRFQISKVYIVEINNVIKIKEIIKIEKGIKIEDREMVPLDIRILRNEKGHSIIEIKIVEGRKRIIRKTFSKLGYEVVDLKRIQIGGFKLGNIKEGNYKVLNKKEIGSVSNC
jgi:23S rRNA pseudouridine2605 synthase